MSYFTTIELWCSNWRGVSAARPAIDTIVQADELDVMMYVVGGPDENEILLFSVVLALRDSLSILLK